MGDSARGCSWARVKAFLIQQHLPLGLAFFTLFGYLVPEPGRALAETPLNTISIVGIFLISGLQLQTSEVKEALKAYPGYIFGFLSILAISPLLCFWVSKWDLGPREFADGMALFMTMPTTISSGVLMTTEAKGNAALSVFLSAGTNLIGVATVPFFLATFLGADDSGAGTGSGGAGDSSVAVNVKLDPLDLLWKLLLTILLPLLIGKSLRYFARVQSFVKAHKMKLKLFSSALLILVPWISISANADLLASVDAGPIFALLGVGSALHLLLFAFNYVACHFLAKVLPLPLAERKAVVINCSQKTMNTAVSVIAFLPPTAGQRGLLTLPVVLAHFAQIIIDAFIVAQWKKVVQESGTGNASEAPAAAAAASGASAPAFSGSSSSAADASLQGRSLVSSADTQVVETELVVVDGASAAKA
jgi:sodium/bile acid cotransporter 7